MKTESITEAPDATARVINPAPTLHNRSLLFFALCCLVVVNILFASSLWHARKIIDFSSFYIAGRIALSSPQSIYDPNTQRSQQLQDFSGDGGWIPFYHPPAELLVFAPLARLPYRTSLALWTLISAGLLLISTRLLSSVIAMEWWRLTILSFALFPTCFAFCVGQDTFLLLLALSSALYLANNGHDKSAGIVLAIALFKPQIPLVIAAALLLQGRRKLVGSFVAAAAAIALATFAVIGRSGTEQLIAMVRYTEPLDDPWRMTNLRGLVSLAHAPQAVAIALSILLLTAFSLRCFRSHQLLPVFSSAILVGTLTAHHFHYYDLSLLLIPIACLLTTKANGIQLAAIFAIAASPVFFHLLAIRSMALLAIPVMVLALSATPFSLASFGKRIQPAIF